MNETTHTPAELQSEQTEFKREVGLFGGISVLGGIMVGSGIFYLGSYVLMRSGMSMGLSLLVWIIGGLITLLSGICYAELGAMMPKAGGSYVYLREAFGERIAFMSGINGFVLGSSGSIAALAIAFPNLLGSFFSISPLAGKAIAIGLIVLLSAINILGIKFGSFVQNIFLIAKLIPIAVILICGLLMGQQTPNLSLIPASQPSFVQLCGMIAFAVVATLWAYEGWTNLNTISEEIKNPHRNLPLAIILAITGVTLLYTLFNFAIYRVLPLDAIAALFNSKSYFLGTEVAGTLFGSTGRLLVSLTMAISVFGALNGCVMVFPRTYYAMAKDGLFFPSCAKLHETYKTPVNAQIASAVISILLVLSRNLDQLTSLVVFSAFIFNILIFYSVIVLRKKYPDLNRPYRVWLYPVSVILTMVIMFGLMINTLIEDPTTSLIGLVVPAAGFVLYEIIRRRKTAAAA
ncbi:MAG: amino acid permease [Negativicutes bacterium]|nr:amino acid permease [Negativicutes bacterium]